MKKFAARGVAALAIVASLALMAPMSAFASGTRPSVSSTTTSTSSTTTTLPVKPKHLDLAAYKQARNAINQAFKYAVTSAQAVFQAARNKATTAADRSTARAAYELALAQAAATRDAGLTSLGKPPSR
jgi:maltose-binding protein MalE